MIWANFLHFYQPPHQDPQILRKIAVQSYQPLLKAVLRHSQVKLNLNINGCLLDLLEKEGYLDVIDSLKELLQKGQLELTGSAKYHAFLPLLPKNEVRRQIEQNELTLRKFFGSLWIKKGFFLPELAYDFKTAQLVKKMGYQWVLAPQAAYGANPPHFDRIYQIKNLEPFQVYFRDKRVSVIILSGYAHSVANLFDEIPDVLATPQRYLLTMMDGETFGHHRPGLENFLEELYQVQKLETIFISDLPKFFPKIEIVEPRSSTWSNEEQDFWLDQERTVVSKHPFLLWQDPSNEIHKLQWEFTDWVVKKIKEQRAKSQAAEEKKKWTEAREKLDQALSSDQYWWASAKPWWSLEMIENGAYHLKDVINTLFQEDSAEGQKAFNYYLKILLLACQWQREGIVRSRLKQSRNPILEIPFKKRATPEEFKQMILEFEDEMKKAAEKLEYEKAIRWRDAIAKLKKGTDIYDAFHVVDQLWAARGKIPQLKN